MEIFLNRDLGYKDKNEIGKLKNMSRIFLKKISLENIVHPNISQENFRPKNRGLCVFPFFHILIGTFI